MHLRTIAIAAALFVTPALAQENGRYQLEQSEDGFVRLDTATGQMSFCTQERGQLSCEEAEDESDALRDEVHRLRSENAELRDELAYAREHPMDDLPTEEEMEEVAGFVERMLIIMMRTVRNAEDEMEREGQ